MSLPLARATACLFVFVAWLASLGAGGAAAQTRILPLGDSITQGGQDHASYRYALWFALASSGYDVDFVGTQTEIFGGGTPNPGAYPAYSTSFDRDHEGRWGQRTDQILADVAGVVAATQPDLVLVHLGTNDIGQLGAAGVVAADTNLRSIFSVIRATRPGVDFLLSRIIPIGPGTSYFANASQVGPLNAALGQIAADLDTPASRVLLVDPNAGFDLPSMMQADGLHPNAAGEAQLASVFRSALATLLSPGNPRPTTDLTSPVENASYAVGQSVPLAAVASDANGFVAAIEFLVDGLVVATDSAAPYSAVWNADRTGNHAISARAIDDQGATGSSEEASIVVLPAGAPTAIPISNPSFEQPALADGALASGPGVVGGWTFAATPNTFVGIFDPPAGSYASAGGDGTPSGADGQNAAFLFNDGGPQEFVSATQTSSATVEAGSDYALQVSIGRFLPGQPYAPSSYGGYVIELLAGTTVIASNQDGISPPSGRFRTAVAIARASTIPSALVGQPLSVRLRLSSSAAPRSTHFDRVLLQRTTTTAVPGLHPIGLGILVAACMALVRVRERARPDAIAGR